MMKWLAGWLLCCASALSAQTTWNGIDYKGEPWVRNDSRPYVPTRGLEGRHLSLWASHGRYYDLVEAKWRWQRPSLYCTTEDLFTQTIVVPFLIPMLENAGAVVFTPRERDWQRHEVIVDNDQIGSLVNYREHSYHASWEDAPLKGFAFHSGAYHDNENPFEAGTARMAETTKNKSKASLISYQPQLPEDGRYAVYVSYQTLSESIDDAHYTVWHKGQKTEFSVNQQMGGSTWVYLGTFDFDAGCNEYNRVVLTNQSRQKGVVTADAVRFGGGMGNIERGGTVSGMPRCLEGARYYGQWAGMPYRVYSSKNGQHDYNDDINVRSLMTNELCGGSPFAPDSTGRNVPIELSLAVHSDAGYNTNGEGVYGTLSICTTQYGDSLLAAGLSREMSKELASSLLTNVTADLADICGTWTARDLYDRNYSETRLPLVPSAILEVMSHENFGDMRYGQDPNVRFTLARSIYKTILKFITDKHDEDYAVTPLTPSHFNIAFDGKDGDVQLSWLPVDDPKEPTAAATGYILYTAKGEGGFDNGTYLHSNHYSMKLEPHTVYHFRVVATNKGGQSFPTQVLSACYNPEATKTIMIVDGFHRVSSPAICGVGFDMDEDPGVSYGRTAGWLGRQLVFDTSRIGIIDSTGLGFSDGNLEGQFVAGNDFNYVKTHADAISKSGNYNIVSCSSEALDASQHYDLIDLALGLERNDGHSVVAYKSFTPHLQQQLQLHTLQGGALMVSGAYIGSDMTTEDEQQFLANTLKCQLTGTNSEPADQLIGMGTQFSFYRQLNESHYAATKTDVLMPTGDAFCAMTYQNGTSAGVAYNGNDYKAMTLAVPFECIGHQQQRISMMNAIIKFLLKQ